MTAFDGFRVITITGIIANMEKWGGFGLFGVVFKGRLNKITAVFVIFTLVINNNFKSHTG
jgi:hypothetical protein